MKKLCFGSFATVLVKCKAGRRVTQKHLCGTIFKSVAPLYDVTTDDRITSDAVRGAANLAIDVTDGAKNANPNDVVLFFQENVVSQLDPNKKKLVILSIRDIIVCDDSIKNDTVVEAVNNFTKKEIQEMNAFVFEDFLVGIFLYSVLNVDNEKNEKVVSAITPDYIQSFELQEPNIALITQYRAITPQTFRELEVDARVLTLLTETGGQCLDCGKPLGIKKDGKDISLAVTVKLNEIDDAIFCVECERKNRSMTEEKRLEIIEKKHNLERRAAAMNAIFEAGIDDQIRAVVLAVNQLDLPDDVNEMHDATMVERKVKGSLLREKIISYVTRRYDSVNDELDRLSGENKLNTRLFGRRIRRMYEDVSEIANSQSEIYNMLVDRLFSATGNRYREACELLISYYVQICEVFDEIAE